METEMIELKPCPFCGSDNIDPRGVATIKAAGPACYNCGASTEFVGDPDVDADAWNTRAAPKVKALEWEGVESDCYVHAETAMGTYSAMIQYSDEWVSEFDAAADKLSPKSVSSICKSMDEAKAAAQSHHEKLILEALE